VARDPLENPQEAIRRLYAYVAYRIGDGPQAEDVVSDAVERAIRYRRSYDTAAGSPMAWLIGIANRLIADQWQEAARREEPLPDDLAAPEGPLAAVEASADLRAAIAQLEERDRELIALRYGADLKAKDIGRVLDMRTNAVEVALHRALARLRAALESGEP
jgi:RNA polymerase sigma-70 factor (ECF subfamily)